MNYRLTIILIACISAFKCYSTAPDDSWTAVADTLQLGRDALTISLPETSLIVIGNNPISHGYRTGEILLDSLDIETRIDVSDVSLASATGVGIQPKKDWFLLKSYVMPNSFSVYLYKTNEGYYLLNACSPKFRISLSSTSKSKDIIDIVEAIFKTIKILTDIEYDNSKSIRKKRFATVRDVSCF